MTTAKPLLYIFQQDLRLSDNLALTMASKSSMPVLTCYILDDKTPGQWIMGKAARWWLHHSLHTLQFALKQKNIQLVFRKGEFVTEILRLVKEINAGAVYWTRMYEPYAIKAEQRLHKMLSEQGVTAKHFPGTLLIEPNLIKARNGNPFKVFTPFWKTCLKQLSVEPVLTKPVKIPTYGRKIQSDKLANWKLLPRKPDWAAGFEKNWSPGETGAHKKIRRFIKQGLQDYSQDRDKPAIIGTSRLSPHLHFGEISPRQIWHAIRQQLAMQTSLQQPIERFLDEIGWREFSYYLLYHWPDLPEKPFRYSFSRFPWKKNKKALKAWQTGQTGFPLIDAGMRELWHTGWMHNRVRMVVASFLVKNLMIHWREGEAWFWDTLVDADLANNSASWQWVAGSGADAAPYFRIFNPVTQSEKFDPEGHYIRQWVPELRKLDGRFIHKPWAAPPDILKQAGFNLGRDYPKPLVDLKLSRQLALEAFKNISRD